MASTPKRSKKLNLSKDACAILYAKFINADINLEDAFGDDLFPFLELYARSRGTTPGLCCCQEWLFALTLYWGTLVVPLKLVVIMSPISTLM